MKTTCFFLVKKTSAYLFLILCCFFTFFGGIAQQNFREYKGAVLDKQTGTPLVYATLTLEHTNVSTITNTEGEFALKVPVAVSEGRLVISFLGYQNKSVSLSGLKSKKNKIMLETSVVELSSIAIEILPKNAKDLVKKVLRKKGDNYFTNQLEMIAFYRETIKKRRRNVSLSEAVVNVKKQSYKDTRRDVVSLFRSRKNTDYNKLDTVALKLQGGPFNALYVDLMKYPEYIFANTTIDAYEFSFGASQKVNDQLIYVINFKQLPTIMDPLYYGSLYIDARTLALTSAEYSLDVSDKKKVSELFVRKKPKNVQVYPTETKYRVDYRQKEGKWYYGYSNVQLVFKINWKDRLFNSQYTLTSEMAITDWESSLATTPVTTQRIRPNIVIVDEASGFSDPDFWGAYNVIEPEKSIESAIHKIQKQLST